MARRIVVDDASAAIEYAATWAAANVAKGGFGPVYRNTTHVTTTDGSRLSFVFNGTSVAVAGPTKVTTLADGTRDPSWACTVDGIAIASGTPAVENGWTLCSVDVVGGPGPHSLALTVHTRGTPVYVDSVLYAPADGAWDVDGAVVEYPNTDASVSFGTGWQAWGAQQLTTTKGAQVAINFHGTEVVLMGYIPNELARTPTTGTYTIDDSPPQTFALAASNASANAVILSATGLTPAVHNLVVTYKGDAGHAPLPVGAFYVTNAVVSSPSSSSSGAGARATATPGPALHKASPVGAIAGGVAGGVGALLLFLLGTVCWRRRRHVAREERDKMEPQPWVMSDAGARASGYGSGPSVRSAGTPSRLYDGPARGYSSPPFGSESGRSDATPSASRLSSAGNTKLEPQRAASPPVVTVVQQHQDSGVRYRPGVSPEVAVVVEELPPGYSRD
ncbi:hypothetical protein MIND_00630400 [Mycena indigotica]|uniref:Uncharacterized protein n=1 Tax=Mycena indigotica TaxID=2126181 RepID=A0A8H6W3W5_9AGAR|nr:uncharacterized protein MIND_00630400 [Mycena indigotica]KAF7303992.1 hypothetical protein MIND_00630400 [Mycena indigotica]